MAGAFICLGAGLRLPVAPGIHKALMTLTAAGFPLATQEAGGVAVSHPRDQSPLPSVHDKSLFKEAWHGRPLMGFGASLKLLWIKGTL